MAEMQLFQNGMHGLNFMTYYQMFFLSKQAQIFLLSGIVSLKLCKNVGFRLKYLS